MTERDRERQTGRQREKELENEGERERERERERESMNEIVYLWGLFLLESGREYLRHREKGTGNPEEIIVS